MTISPRARPFSDRNVVPAELRTARHLPPCSPGEPDVGQQCPLDAWDFGHMRTGQPTLDDDHE